MKRRMKRLREKKKQVDGDGEDGEVEGGIGIRGDTIEGKGEDMQLVDLLAQRAVIITLLCPSF